MPAEKSNSTGQCDEKEYKLFLDDDRDPSLKVDRISWRKMVGLPRYTDEQIAALERIEERNGPDWVVARSVVEAIGIVESRGLPGYVSFDHDLGAGPNGYDFARWLIKRDLNRGDMPATFQYYAHSANPVGRRNIIGAMDSYLRFKTAG